MRRYGSSLFQKALIVSKLLKVSLLRLTALVFLLWLSLISFFRQKPVLLIIEPYGNLGNRLFLYAVILAFAIENNSLVLNPAFGHWRNAFAGIRRGLIASYPASLLPGIPGISFQRLVLLMCNEASHIGSLPVFKFLQCGTIELCSQEYLCLESANTLSWINRKNVVFLKGFLFVAPRSLKSHADKIRSYCRQVQGVGPSALYPVHKLRSCCDIVVGVVVRYGDYREWQGGKFFYPLSSYERWIRELNDLFSGHKVGFFICSNDDLDLSSISDINFSFRFGHDLENRAALTLCDFILSPPSTYAGWASFVGDVPVHWLVSSTCQLNIASFATALPLDPSDSSFSTCSEIVLS